MMLSLQAQGCHNINLVSPSHVVPQILAGLLIAAEAGLCLPLVYNTGGYDSLKTLALLDGVIDIYMPDMKYADPDVGQRLSRSAAMRRSPRRRQGDAPARWATWPWTPKVWPGAACWSAT